jgi:2-polyprenyl-3-methyl-5-hydroxy-6-metoxy-1,4-benzoquinol methylase
MPRRAVKTYSLVADRGCEGEIVNVIGDQARTFIRDGMDQTLTRLGFGQRPDRLMADSRTYWTGGQGEAWAADSHWRGGLAENDWTAIGAAHWALWEMFARAVGAVDPLERIVDWGCGGGANAVAFAPHSAEYIGADIVPATVQECKQQVAMVCDTPFSGVVIDPVAPEISAQEIPKCDLFICFYVLELVPTPEYGLRILRIAANLLRPGRYALIQIKYRTGWRTASRGRRYRSHTAATMTSYRIEEFWHAATRCGLIPHLVHLVPRNALDERYAYFLLSAAPS